MKYQLKIVQQNLLHVSELEKDFMLQLDRQVFLQVMIMIYPSVFPVIPQVNKYSFYKMSLTLLFMIQVLVIRLDPNSATITVLNALCHLYEINCRI